MSPQRDNANAQGDGVLGAPSAPLWGFVPPSVYQRTVVFWIACYAGGVVLSRAVGAAGALPVGPFRLYLSLPAYAVLAWAILRILARGPRLRCPGDLGIAAVCTGVLFDQAVFLIAREHAGQTFYGTLSLTGSAVCAAIAVGAVLVASVSTRGREGDTPAFSWWTVILLAVIQAVSLLGFRLSQMYMLAQNIPNEERSFMVRGFEVHHIVHGTLLMGLAGILAAFHGGGRWRHRVALLLFSVGSAFVADEFLYYWYDKVTDERYFELPSTIGGVVASLGIVAVALYEHRRAHSP